MVTQVKPQKKKTFTKLPIKLENAIWLPNLHKNFLYITSILLFKKKKQKKNFRSYRKTSFRTSLSSHHHNDTNLGGYEVSGLGKSIPDEFRC